jgi:hypothetical protein
MKVSRLPAALAYKLIRRECSPADLGTLAMLWPRGGHVPQRTKAGRAIKPGQGASNLAPPLQPLPGASPGQVPGKSARGQVSGITFRTG